ncbi:MAG: hypothetical protein IJB68_07060 [Ruminococcus sp.]|nr:hypothetical protein [Ruminococcus sp.]
MKKLVTFLLLLAMTLPVTACDNKQENTSQPENSVQQESSITTESNTAETEQPQTVSPTKLTNKMTEMELDLVNRHALTLLDEIEKPNADPNAEHKVSIEFQSIDLDEYRKNLEENRSEIGDEQYEAGMEEIRIAEEKGEESFPLNPYILVDGYIVPWLIPTADDFNDGGSFSFTSNTIEENGEQKVEYVSFDSMEEYLDYIREQNSKFGHTNEEIEIELLHVQLAYEALKNGNYETLPEGSVDINDESLYIYNALQNYRSDWEFDRDSVEAIKDSVDEIYFYDEELHRPFVVHVTLPPDYDESKTYPVFFLTDGIWRFGNHPELRKVMENGEAAPVILVSLYYSYDISDPDQNMRYGDLVIDRNKLLDFITDNLMPYLCENYNIDCANSTLYGHSDGGVFTHNAVFNSDRYENQPFGHYIIGSPALWGLYHYNLDNNMTNDDVLNDYGYFDRNETLDKTIFLCAGSLEDPDYEQNYREGDDTTLEGVAKLKERLEAHGVNLTHKLYESHHYQYIPEMLVEYLKKRYPID